MCNLVNIKIKGSLCNNSQCGKAHTHTPTQSPLFASASRRLFSDRIQTGHSRLHRSLAPSHDPRASCALRMLPPPLSSVCSHCIMHRTNLCDLLLLEHVLAQRVLEPPLLTKGAPLLLEPRHGAHRSDAVDVGVP